MSGDIVIIDTQTGNIQSLKKAVEFLGHNPLVSSNWRKIRKAKILFLPGVGSFDKVATYLQTLGIDDGIKEVMDNLDNRILGICLGMQLLASSSEEGSSVAGLNLIGGKVVKFDNTSAPKIPHVGFNEVEVSRENSLFKGILSGSDFYFLHSYFISEESCEDSIAHTTYGNRFVAAVEKDHRFFGTQFHPEKSQGNGIRLISNFLTG